MSIKVTKFRARCGTDRQTTDDRLFHKALTLTVCEPNNITSVKPETSKTDI